MTGKWAARLAEHTEKNSKTPQHGTDKTDETLTQNSCVSFVGSLPGSFLKNSHTEKNSKDPWLSTDKTAETSFVSFGGTVSGSIEKNFSPNVEPIPGRISKPIPHCNNRQWNYRLGCWHDETHAKEDGQ